MRLILIIGLGVLAITAGALHLLRHNRSNAPEGTLVLRGGVHFELPPLDLSAPGAQQVQKHSRPELMPGFTEAERAARRAVYEYPNSPGARYNLGVVLQWQMRPTEAIHAYREVLELDPGHNGAIEALRTVEWQLQARHSSPPQ